MFTHSFFRQPRERLAHVYPHQRGLMGLLMVGFVLAFAGLFILSIDGVRALQNKARFDEAADIATLAVSSNALNSITESQQKQIVKNYFYAYFKDLTLNDADINITATEGTCTEDDVTCIKDAVYTQYELSVSGSFAKILGTPVNVASFADEEGNYQVSGGGMARRFDATSIVEPKDVIFVADFSGSMDWSWNGRYAPVDDSSSDAKLHRRYKEALSVIDQIAETLQNYNDSVENGEKKNTVGMVPFGPYTFASSRTSERFILDQGYGDFRYTYRYWSWTYWEWRYGYGYVDYRMYAVENDFLRSNYSITTSSYSYMDYHNVSLTDNISQFRSTVSGFSPSGGTASYKGLLRSAIMAASGDNAKRIIIILSDGDDTAETGYYQYDGLPYLINNSDDLTGYEYKDGSNWVTLSNRTQVSDGASREMGNYFVDPDNDTSTADGFCTYMRNNIQSQTTSDGEDVSLDIIFIRFGASSLGSGHWIRSCLGEEDIYAGDEVDSWDEVVEIIENLVLDEGQYLYAP